MHPSSKNSLLEQKYMQRGMDTTDSKWPRNINESLGRTPDTDLRHGFSEHLCSPDAIRGNFEDENYVKIDSPSPNNKY